MRLKKLAEPFVDREPEDVIKRLLDRGELNTGAQVGEATRDRKRTERSPTSRVPRERGARVQVGDQILEATSVRDLYEQALRFFVEHHKSKLETVVPLRTSKERFLIARDPAHPGGNPFVVPVQFRGFHMEAHKDYKNAIEHLEKLGERLGLQVTYLG